RDEQRQREHRREHGPPKPREPPRDLEAERRHEQQTAAVPEPFADARIAEDQMEDAGNPSIERLEPERLLAALEPVPLHHDAVRRALEAPEVIPRRVKEELTDLRNRENEDERQPGDADEQEHAADISKAARRRHNR